MRTSLAMIALATTIALVACGARTELEGNAADCPAPADEICNGIDDDCDGDVDEGVPPVTCGENGCQVTVRCEDGVMPECRPREPSPEACNLLDDDCDGAVDEGFGFGPLGEPIALRTTEFDTGTCSTCKWAWGTTVAPTERGFLALWNLGLYGGAEQPNLYGRTLDASGEPTGPITLLREDYVLEVEPMAALAPMPPSGLPIEATYRVGANDVYGLLFATPAGGTEIYAPIAAFGPRNVPRTVWTGERFVSAWEDEQRLRVAVLRPDGSQEREVQVEPLERPAAITLGVYTDRVGLLVSRYQDDSEQRDQWLIVLDGRGEVVEPAHRIDVAWASWQRLVGTEEGWLHIRPNGWDEPSTRQPLDPSGNPLAEPTPFPDGRHIDDSGLSDVFIPRPGLGETFVAWQGPTEEEMTVEFLDARGERLRGWSGTLPADPYVEGDYLVSPHATFVGERVLLTWHGLAPDDQPNPVFVRAFGCVP